jgi:hypothetical protein
VDDQRQAKGVSFVELVKLLKNRRRKHPFSGLSAEAEGLFGQHLLPTGWYPFPPVAELIDLAYRELLRGSAEAALQMGIAGGTHALRTYHRGFIRPGDPLASLLAMRRSWSLYFDFGELTTKQVGERGVVFQLDGYPDISAAHGPMVVGWHRAAGLVAGVKNLRGEIVECPWTDGSPRLVHRVEF